MRDAAELRALETELIKAIVLLLVTVLVILGGLPALVRLAILRLA